MNELFIYYCAFTYGYEFAKLMHVADGSDIGLYLFSTRYPITAFFILLALFLFSPLTFLIGRLMTIFSIVFNIYKGDLI